MVYRDWFGVQVVVVRPGGRFCWVVAVNLNDLHDKPDHPARPRLDAATSGSLSWVCVNAPPEHLKRIESDQ